MLSIFSLRLTGILALLGAGCASLADDSSHRYSDRDDALREAVGPSLRVTNPACSANTSGESDAAPDASRAESALSVATLSAQLEAWGKYTRDATYTVSASEVRVPMRDGAKLACTLNRPGSPSGPASGTFPGLVVEFTPYALYRATLNQEAAFFTQRGYNTLVCTLRGIGGSEGTWQGVGASQDRRDAHDLVEWLAAQPFADGRVGQFGESYGGQTTYGAATERPPHLRAIAPMQPPADLYDDVNYPGGVETVRDGTINNWPPIAQFLSGGVIKAEDEYATWHEHPTHDAYWDDRSLTGRIASVNVPVLTIGGWVDGFFRAGSIANIEAALDRTWAFYGQWAHVPPVDLGTCAVSSCAAQPLPSGILLAWFDHWVMELPNVPLPAKPTFASEEGPRGVGRGWRQLSRWGGELATAETYRLQADGLLTASAGPGSGDPMKFTQPGEADRAGASLTFTTGPLEADRVLIGRATLQFDATLSAADANFYVQLIDVGAEGGETVVNDGFLRASHRESHVNPAPVQVGKAISYSVLIRPQHYRFVAGHRLRLRLWGGAGKTVVPLPQVTVAIDHATLKLPGFAESY